MHACVVACVLLQELEDLLNEPWYGVCSLANVVLLSNLLASLCYLTAAHITRLLAIRRMENKAIFRDLAEIAFRLKGQSANNFRASQLTAQLASQLPN